MNPNPRVILAAALAARHVTPATKAVNELGRIETRRCGQTVEELLNHLRTEIRKQVVGTPDQGGTSEMGANCKAVAVRIR
jgi:hypothetical protein